MKNRQTINLYTCLILSPNDEIDLTDRSVEYILQDDPDTPLTRDQVKYLCTSISKNQIELTCISLQAGYSAYFFAYMLNLAEEGLLNKLTYFTISAFGYIDPEHSVAINNDMILGEASLLNILAKLREINKLEFMHLCVDYTILTINFLADWLSQKNCSLKELDITESTIDDAAFLPLKKALKINTSLTRINFIEDGGMYSFSPNYLIKIMHKNLELKLITYNRKINNNRVAKINNLVSFFYKTNKQDERNILFEQGMVPSRDCIKLKMTSFNSEQPLKYGYTLMDSLEDSDSSHETYAVERRPTVAWQTKLEQWQSLKSKDMTSLLKLSELPYFLPARCLPGGLKRILPNHLSSQTDSDVQADVCLKFS